MSRRSILCLSLALTTVACGDPQTSAYSRIDAATSMLRFEFDEDSVAVYDIENHAFVDEREDDRPQLSALYSRGRCFENLLLVASDTTMCEGDDDACEERYSLQLASRDLVGPDQGWETFLPEFVWRPASGGVWDAEVLAVSVDSGPMSVDLSLVERIEP